MLGRVVSIVSLRDVSAFQSLLRSRTGLALSSGKCHHAIWKLGYYFLVL